MWNALRCGLNKIKISSLRLPCIRHYMKTSDKMALLLKQSDHVPYDFDLVYRYTNYKSVSRMYHTVNFITCVTITTAGYYVYQNGFTKTENDLPEVVKMFESPIQTAVVLFTLTITFIYATILRKRLVIRIYHDTRNNMYKAIFTGKVPFTIEHHNFPAATMSRLSRESILPWKRTLFNANGHKVMLFEDYFRTHNDFYQMLEPSELENLKDDSEE